MFNAVPAGTVIAVMLTWNGSMVPAHSTEPAGITKPAGRTFGIKAPEGGWISAVVVQLADKVTSDEVVTAIEIATFAAIALTSISTS